MGRAKLGVNIDHVATLKQARKEGYPSIEKAAALSLEAGADQITVHLREDRRHIEDCDIPVVREVTKKLGKQMNFELGNHASIVEMALETMPDWVCLVPEKREEMTTEGGLDLLNDSVFDGLTRSVSQFKERGIKVSLFVEADQKILKRCSDLKVEAVEIHTGDYCRLWSLPPGQEPDQQDIEKYLGLFHQAKLFCQDHNLLCHAGHGLTHESLLPLLKQGAFVEYNIGHWIICQAVFDGLPKVVKDVVELFDQWPLS